MGQAGRPLNVPDLVLGIALLLALPLLTLYSLSGPPPGPSGPPGAQGPAIVPLTLDEVDEGKAAFERMYKQNAKLFLIRSQDQDLQPRDQAQEASWARSALERCQQGFAGLLTAAREAPRTPEMLARVTELEDWVRKVDAGLRGLPAGPPAGLSAAGKAGERSAR